MEASALPDAGIEDRDEKSKTRRPFGEANQPEVGAEAEAEEHACFLVRTLGTRSLARTLRLTNVSDVQLAYHRGWSASRCWRFATSRQWMGMGASAMLGTWSHWPYIFTARKVWQWLMMVNRERDIPESHRASLILIYSNHEFPEVRCLLPSSLS